MDFREDFLRLSMMQRVGCLASRSQYHHAYKGCPRGQRTYRRTETLKSRQCHRSSVIACFCNFVASCSFPLCVTAKVRRENGNVRHVVELSFERLLKHTLRTRASTSVIASVGRRRQDRQDISNEIYPFPFWPGRSSRQSCDSYPLHSLQSKLQVIPYQ